MKIYLIFAILICAIGTDATAQLALPAPQVESQSTFSGTSRNSKTLPPNPKGRKLGEALMADFIAFRQVWGNEPADAYTDDGFTFRQRLVHENFVLNMCIMDENQFDRLIEVSGCDTGWSAKRMQDHLKSYLVDTSDDPRETRLLLEAIGKYGFGWLGEPGDQSLDLWRFTFGLRPGETLGDTVRSLVPADFQIGGIPLRPMSRHDR